MDGDNGKRGSCGLVISLNKTESGKLRVVMDDVSNESETGRGPWHHHTFFTFKDYEEEALSQLKLSNKELADIGYSILMRLGIMYEQSIK